MMKGLDILIYINGKVVGAQASAQLNRTTKIVDISNKITLDWDNFAIGSKSWSVSCAGAYIVNDEAFQALETAYFEGNPVEVEFKKEGVLTMKGQAIITSFPLNAVFNNDLSYSINLQGKGALTK